MDVSYVTGALQPRQLPKETLPEIAIVGRSNVGKSSLINAVTNRRDLARTSRTPGRTALAHFFLVNGKWLMVDLPGYGFSIGGKKERPHWSALMDAYFQRQSLKRVLFLFDPRRDWQDEDQDLLEHVAAHTEISFVFTKIDKVKKSQLNRRRDEIAKLLASNNQAAQITMTSTLKRQGIDSLRGELFPSRP